VNPSDPFGLVGLVLDGQFRVDKLVGEGGFSAVYRGHHLGLDEPVAIKCLKLPPSLGYELVESFVQRFRDESRILYRLSQGNLHVVRSIGAGATKAPNANLIIPYMVLEWLEGRSMANDFTVRRTLGKTGRSLDEVVALFATAADALAFAHGQGVVHRDLNPGNLFLAKTPQGEKMKVLDFGVAKILDDATLNLGPRAQTLGQIRIFAPAYGAPEQFDDTLGKVTARADVYAFGLVLLEALRDRPVHDSSNLSEFATAAIDPKNRPTPRSLGLDLPEAVERVFVRASLLDPMERFQHVGEMWKALESAVGSKKSPSNHPLATPLSRTLPLNSPNLNLPRPSPGLPSKSGNSVVPAPIASKLKPAASPHPAAAASAARSGVGAAGHHVPAPPPRGVPTPSLGKGTVHGLAPPPMRLVAEPPLDVDEELPTRVGHAPTADPPASGSPVEDDVTRVRRPEDDLLAAATATNVGKLTKPSPVPPPPDSDRTVIMPPGGGGVPLPPAPGRLAPQSPPEPAVAPPPMPNFETTMALSGPVVQRPPRQPLQPMQSAPFSSADWQRPTHPAPVPSPGLPAHFAQPQPPMHFQGGGYPPPPAQPAFAEAKPAPAQQGKPPIGLLIGAAVFLVIGIGGAAAFWMLGRSTPTAKGPTASASVSVEASAVPVPVPVSAEAPTPTPAEMAPPPVDTGVAAGTALPAADAIEAGTAATAATNTTPPPNPTHTPTSNAPVPVATPIAVAKPKETAPPIDPNAWNEAAARGRLAQANGVLVYCRKPDEPTGPGSATVTYSPEGTVTSVILDPPYAGTKAGDCVAGQFKRAKINSFQGTSQTIKHSFDVPK
jgi:serine/threonine protein kinase